MANHSKDFIINSSVIFLAYKIIIVELSTEITGLTLLIRVNQSTLILHSLKGLTTLNNISLITTLSMVRSRSIRSMNLQDQIQESAKL